MNLGELYNYINYVTNKEQLGDPPKPDSFNLLLKNTVNNTFSEYVREFVRMISDGQTRIADILTDTHPLKHFEASKRLFYIGVDKVKLIKPDNYAHYVTIAGYIGGIFRNVEVLNRIKFDERRRNLLAAPIEEYPIANEETDSFSVVPNTINKFELTYFRKPEAAYFDYCVDENDNILYMPIGSELRKSGEIISLYDSTGALIAENVFPAKTITSYPYKSISKELDWPEMQSDIIVNKIINDVLVRSREAAQQPNK